jgi:hypothetical protein
MLIENRQGWLHFVAPYELLFPEDYAKIIASSKEQQEGARILRG